MEGRALTVVVWKDAEHDGGREILGSRGDVGGRNTPRPVEGGHAHVIERQFERRAVDNGDGGSVIGHV